mgnify:CR=1 FL=1
MKKEVSIFLVALQFYTRIPCRLITEYDPEIINKASRYFPLIGWLVGALTFFAFWVTSLFLSTPISIIISILVGILLTGAFHEDGLADTFDGFGGGWSKEKILEIMKDSRIGTYGVISLILLIGLKYFALSAIVFALGETTNYSILFLMFLTYHSMARLTAINIVFTSVYSRDDEKSKSKLISKACSHKEILGAYFFGLTPLFALCYLQILYIFALIPLIALYFFAKRFFEKWIGGYTGDCLGAVEQIAELFILLTFVCVWKFI